RPTAIAIDSRGNLFVTDFDNHIRRVDARTGIITTVAGNGTQAFSGDGGPATSASIGPSAIAIDGAGNLFIADFTGRIRRVDAHNRIITTIAGNGKGGFRGDGGVATDAGFIPGDIKIDSQG